MKSRRLSNLPKVRQPTIGRTKIWTLPLKTYSISPPCSNNSCYLLSLSGTRKFVPNLLGSHGNNGHILSSSHPSNTLLPPVPAKEIEDTRYNPSKRGKFVGTHCLDLQTWILKKGDTTSMETQINSSEPKNTDTIIVCGPAKLNATIKSLLLNISSPSIGRILI